MKLSRKERNFLIAVLENELETINVQIQAGKRLLPVVKALMEKVKNETPIDQPLSIRLT